MFTIRKEFSFSASHQLMGLPKEHPCSRLHGHNYVVTVELRSATLKEVGFIKDYRELDFIKKYLDSYLDHQHLNDVFSHNPTAELMAKTLFRVFKETCPELFAVEVSETPKTSARYEITYEL